MYDNILLGRCRVFVRAIDQNGRVVDAVGECHSVQFSVGSISSGSYRAYRSHPIGDLKLSDLEVAAARISEPGASQDHFLHDDKIPSPYQVYPDNPVWFSVLAYGTYGNRINGQRFDV